ncbi:MAG TPA: hemerythrin domain-containing protein [Geminicoccaceae bacterium]|nr:hemerythrin domain-containing protein [Geminicoccaceae bacterium]
MAATDGWLSGRTMAAMVGGAAVALVASRVLPPLLAQLAGTARAALGRDPFAGLIADHRDFLSLLERMERTEARGRPVFQRTQLLVRLKRGLAAHAMAEEDVVYPLLHDEAKAEHDAMHLYGEHADMKMHLYWLEQMPKDHPQWVARVRELRRLIEEHARQEEEVEFPRLRALMDERAGRRVSGQVQREKALLL